MSNGTGTTFVLPPLNRSALTFSTGAMRATSGYVLGLELGSLDLALEQRWQYTYENTRARRATETFVPLRFTVIIKATSTTTRQQAYHALDLAVRAGGTVQYQPEGASRATYYYYAPSPPPSLLDERHNRFDASATSDGNYTVYVDVTLQTYPTATSDPDSPVTLADLSDTLDNWTGNALTVDGDDVLGSVPALVRLLITPNSGQSLGRVVIFRRSAADGTLVNLTTLYEAEDADVIVPSSAWSEIADANRGDGAYMRCLPSDDTPHGLRFTLVNPQDCHGRFAVFGVGYDGAYTTGLWTHQVKLKSGNVTQEGANTYYAEATQMWRLIFAGEFELPLTDLSAVTTGYDDGPYLEWHCAYAGSTSGSSEFRLDAIVLVWVSDAQMETGTALSAWCDDETGLVSPNRLLLENYLDRYGHSTHRAYVVAADDDVLYVPQHAARGEFVELPPGEDQRLIFIQERHSGALLDDDFGSYQANLWLPIAQMESDEGWDYSSPNAGPQTSTYVEGDQARQLTFDSTSQFYDQWYEDGRVLDLSNDGRFTDDDYICIAFWADTHIEDIRIEYRDGGDFFYYEWSSLSAGWNYVCVKRDDLLSSGSPSWGHIDSLNYNGTLAGWYGSNEYLIADYWRVEKADPDDATCPNATGDVWDFQPDTGVWAVTPDETLACLDIEAGVEKVALLDQSIPDNIRLRARVCAKRDAGYVGVLWRAADGSLTEGNEIGYVVVLDITNDLVRVRRYSGSSVSVTLLDSEEMTLAVDTWYVIGVLARWDTHYIYVAAVADLTDDADVFDPAHLQLTISDSTYSSGKIGLISVSTLGRFDAIVLESVDDRVIPDDEITVSGKAIFRTLAPFS